MSPCCWLSQGFVPTSFKQLCVVLAFVTFLGSKMTQNWVGGALWQECGDSRGLMITCFTHSLKSNTCSAESHGGCRRRRKKRERVQNKDIANLQQDHMLRNLKLNHSCARRETTTTHHSCKSKRSQQSRKPGSYTSLKLCPASEWPTDRYRM